ncbi:MAG: DUF116 domain-containing protein [Paenibacillus sp.]|nr:DUF116 domain-containing protein [Paenibacillus sp.]
METGGMETVTYSLYGDSADSHRYYEDTAAFTDEVMNKMSEEDGIDEFSRYIADRNLKPMGAEIYKLELLMIGVLWRIYGNIEYNLDSFGKLIGWMQASGEFEQESQRMTIWYDFLKGKPRREVEHRLSTAMKLAEWFDKRSEETLGRYTLHVNSYIDGNRESLKGKGNQIFCMRQRVEYHLNMVGAEIMNRVFRSAFLETKEKRVFLPICMRLKPNEACRAVPMEQGLVCRGCSNDCQVNTITTMGKEQGYKVLIIPHASTAFGQRHMAEGEVGIIGVACVLNLISGGYKAKELGYEPQCVLLNYAGCIKHWHQTGIVTSLALERLQYLLQFDPAVSQSDHTSTS